MRNAIRLALAMLTVLAIARYVRPQPAGITDFAYPGCTAERLLEAEIASTR